MITVIGERASPEVFMLMRRKSTYRSGDPIFLSRIARGAVWFHFEPLAGLTDLAGGLGSTKKFRLAVQLNS